jgi:putative hydrolase of the HAD superfamily
VARAAAVLFDVDFTLIHPGPRFQARGYAERAALYGMRLDPARFDEAVAASAPLLESIDHVYDAGVFERYTRRIIERMGGAGPRLDELAREMSVEWADNRHFTLYDDVRGALEQLVASGVRIGLVSNTHRCLDAFESHFKLEGLIHATVSSADHGFMKPHPSIFLAALERLAVGAPDAVMVGDSLVHDVAGALAIGMRGVLLARRIAAAVDTPTVPVIRSLSELGPLLREL